MQTYQMAILLLFENVDVMTCKEIQVNTMVKAFYKTILLLNDSSLEPLHLNFTSQNQFHECFIVLF